MFNNAVGNPFKVGLIELQLGEGICPVSIKPCRDQDEIWPMRCQRRPPVPVDGPTEARAASARGQRCVDNVGAVYIMHTARVVGVLKAGADQNLRNVLAKIHSAVAVVDVEIQYGHPAHVRASQGIDGRDRYAVEQAKPHRSAQLSMVSRWPDRAEDTVRLPRQHVGHTLPDGSGGIQGSVKALGSHPGVRV